MASGLYQVYVYMIFRLVSDLVRLTAVGTDQNSSDPQYLVNQLTLDAFRGAGLQKGGDLMERMGPNPSAWKREDFDRMNQYLVNFVLIRQAGNLACFARPDQFLEELILRVGSRSSGPRLACLPAAGLQERKQA